MKGKRLVLGSEKGARGMKVLRFDLMLPLGGGRERFVATMRYEWNGLLAFDAKAMLDWIYERRPSLRGRAMNCYPEGEAVDCFYFNQDVKDIVRQNR